MGAFPLSEHSADSALLLTLVPGAYPAQTLGLNNATGVALVEVYDDVGSTPTSGRLTNAAVRTHNPGQRGQRHERSRTGGSVRGSVIRS